MARIPENEIERLKNEVSVQRLVEASGIGLKKAGKDLLGRCPFHEDDTASLVVTPAKNLWHCFGCGIGGGPIDWVIKKNGVSFRHAVELLRDGVSSLAAGVGAAKRSTVRALPAPVAGDADDRTLLGQVIGYYHATLKQSPEALAYLESRGLAGAAAMDAIDTFKLGYANRTLGLRLPAKNRVAGAELRTRLQGIGIYRESGHEHFNGSLIVPILDESGNAVEVYGRKVRDDLRPGTPKHLYLPGPHAGVFNRAVLMPGACEELIVCEALIDALTFWCAGYRNVTSAYGVEGVTDEFIEAIKAAGIKRVLIAFDRDEAGERGAAKFRRQEPGPVDPQGRVDGQRCCAQARSGGTGDRDCRAAPCAGGRSPFFSRCKTLSRNHRHPACRRRAGRGARHRGQRHRARNRAGLRRRQRRAPLARARSAEKPCGGRAQGQRDGGYGRWPLPCGHARPVRRARPCRVRAAGGG